MMLTKLLAAGLGMVMVWRMNQAPDNPRQRQLIFLTGSPIVALFASL